MNDLRNIISTIQSINGKIGSVLNLGSGSSIYLFELLDNPGIEEFVFVDKENIFKDLKFGLTQIIDYQRYSKKPKSELEVLIDSATSIYDLYKILAQFSKAKKVHSLQEFQSITRFAEYDIIEFLHNDDKKYDLVLLSKVISHLSPSLDKCKNLLEIIRSKLSSNGILYLRVNGADYPFKKPNDRMMLNSMPLRNFTLKEFENLIEHYDMASSLQTVKIEDEFFEAEEYWSILTPRQ